MDIGASTKLELVNKFCYLGDMRSCWTEMLMPLWRPEFELAGISSGSWYHCLPIGRVSDYERKVVQQLCEKQHVAWK